MHQQETQTKPHRKRRIKRLSIVGANTQPRLKQKKRNKVMQKTICLPQTSYSGANMRGPVAKPIRKVVTPSVATVREYEKLTATPPLAAAWMLEQKVIVVVMNTMVKLTDHFLLAGQLVGTWPLSSSR